MKDTNAASLHLTAISMVRLPGMRTFPRLLACRMGCMDESKKCFLRDASWIMRLGGSPSTSIMHSSCSCSFSPGNSG